MDKDTNNNKKNNIRLSENQIHLLSTILALIIVGGCAILLWLLIEIIKLLADEKINSVITLLIILFATLTAYQAYKDKRGHNSIRFIVRPREVLSSNQLKIHIKIKSKHMYRYVKDIEIYSAGEEYGFLFFRAQYIRDHTDNCEIVTILVNKFLSPGESWECDKVINLHSEEDIIYCQVTYRDLDKKLFGNGKAVNALPSLEEIKNSLKNNENCN